MYLSQGIDIVEVRRIKKILVRYKNNFLKKILSNKEYKLLDLSNNIDFLSEKIANKFAAKEAALKALGTGVSQNISFNDLEILNDKFGKPIISFLGNANKKLIEIKNKNKHQRISVSISSEKKYSVAIVTIIFF